MRLEAHRPASAPNTSGEGGEGDAARDGRLAMKIRRVLDGPAKKNAGSETGGEAFTSTSSADK
jgi:hypothetical protein